MLDRSLACPPLPACREPSKQPPTNPILFPMTSPHSAFDRRVEGWGWDLLLEEVQTLQGMDDCRQVCRRRCCCRCCSCGCCCCLMVNSFVAPGARRGPGHAAGAGHAKRARKRERERANFLSRAFFFWREEKVGAKSLFFKSLFFKFERATEHQLAFSPIFRSPPAPLPSLSLVYYDLRHSPCARRASCVPW